MPTTHDDHLARGARVAIRPLVRADRAEFIRLAAASTALHHPWLFPPLTRADFDAYLDRLAEPTREGFALVLAETGGLAGWATVNNIVHGGFRCGSMGYGGFAPTAGRGLVAEGVDLVTRYVLGPLGLHRIEVNIQPGNARSIALAERLGYRLEGFSPDFLYIDGAWRDHQRWAITAEMLRGATAGR